jgi:hypothetical protein
MKIKSLIALSSVFLLGGCAMHMSKEQCQNTNWYQLGETNGSNGQNVNLGNDISDCRKYHISVDVKAYQRGWNAGIKNFCTYQKGYSFGSSGRGNPNVCPAGNLQRQFNEGFRKGANIFCRNSKNGFALGREGKGFPGACDSSSYLAFNTSYQQGRAIYDRTSEIRNQISSIDNRISTLVGNYRFEERSDGYYKLGHRRQNSKAQYRLKQVNRMVSQRNRLKTQLFNASVTN